MLFECPYEQHTMIGRFSRSLYVGSNTEYKLSLHRLCKSLMLHFCLFSSSSSPM